MQGQESFQIIGDVEEVEGSGFSDEDISTVMEKTDVAEKKLRMPSRKPMIWQMQF